MRRSLLSPTLDLQRPLGDVAGVNLKTPAKFIAPIFFSVAWLSCAAKAPAPTVVPLDHNTYSIVIEASNGFTRDTAKLKARAEEEAAKYCAAQGKYYKLVSLTEEKPWFSLGYVKARIVFKALDSTEPEAVAVAAPASYAAAAAASAAPVAVPARESITPTGDLYNDLLKLDDLRKRGILTDEEFQAEKKKVLDRSK